MALALALKSLTKGTLEMQQPKYVQNTLQFFWKTDNTSETEIASSFEVSIKPVLSHTSLEDKRNFMIDFEIAANILKERFGTAEQIFEGIKKYRPSLKNLKGLDLALNFMKGSKRLSFWTKTLPFIQNLALCQDLFEFSKCLEYFQPFFLTQDCDRNVLISQKAIAIYLAQNFMLLFSDLSRGSLFPAIDFSTLMCISDWEKEHKVRLKAQKLIAFISYFEILCRDGISTGFIEVERLSYKEEDYWQIETGIGEIELKCSGRIEDSHGSVHLDFANKYLGGGVLNRVTNDF